MTAKSQVLMMDLIDWLSKRPQFTRDEAEAWASLQFCPRPERSGREPVTRERRGKCEVGYSDGEFISIMGIGDTWKKACENAAERMKL